MLAPLTAQQVVEELRSRLPDGAKDIALVCYEKPNDFCHRHLVGKWLRENGIECREWEPEKYEQLRLGEN